MSKQKLEKLREELRKKNQIRYNLHREIRKEGYKLKTSKRTIYVFFKTKELSEKVLRLRNEFGYAVQTELTN